MLGLNTAEEHKEAVSAPQASHRMVYKVGFISCACACQLPWFCQRPLLFPVRCLGKAISTFNSERAGRRSGWDFELKVKIIMVMM